MADALPLSGGIDPKAFPFVIAQLHRQGATGSLKVDGPSYQKAVYFRAGRILFGSSNDPKDQLGAILIETGRISPEQLEEVNAKVGPGNPLAKVLAESGFVNQRELSEAARTKVERILADILSYDSGSFEFEDGVLPKGAVDLKLVTERLIVAAVRRIADRAFVLRHIDGLDVVLAPTPESASQIAELDADTTVLPQRFDGHRNIKDAAAEARLDEFDAAKIACALLFLGLVHEVQPEALEATQADSPALFTPGDLGAELDLGEEARLAVDGAPAPSDVDATLLITEPPDFDTAPPTPLEAMVDTPPPIPVPITPVPTPAASAPPRTVTPSFPVEPPLLPPVVRAPAPPPPPPPASYEPETIILPAPGEGPLTSGFFEAQPSTFAEEAPAPTTKMAPPSKEDLAALDALLNARHVEGPLAPFEKTKGSADARWEPRFDGGDGGRRSGGRRSSGNRSKLVAALAVLAVAVAAGAWYFLGDTLGLGRNPAAPATTVAAAPTTTLAPATTMPPSLPPELSAPATTPPVTAAAASPAPTPTHRATPPPPTTLAPRSGKGTPSLAEARAAFRRGAFDEAGRGFEANVRAARHTFTVQLLVACSDETVSKAVAAVSAPDLFVIPVKYQGRACYRMCWGLYDNETRARAGIGSVPEYFRKGGATPKAVSSASILP